ncbi:TetR/AcrR family transcriptional regulator [Paenibacillus xylaniclasticus]|uniref:TetR/AcrR family transcriptional regulator n=1 Tax=Paenibacillus xylaniclasticus TaxID=588083 RepID=UPI000FD939AE|nr:MULTISPECIES: TetR/AcrR family transcriptional regulator [Paenibacillus]GFN32173.1 TetR family transcriptional regulator [Paenibacillus curdlanolyticus]
MSDNRGKDRRVARTRSMIADALMEILQQKTYDEISITDIAEQADINRSTFYAHFIDKDDLLSQLVSEKLDVLKTLLYDAAASTTTPSRDSADPIFTTLFQHVMEQHRFYSLMLTRYPNGQFRSMLTTLIKDSFFVRISKLGLDQQLQVPLELLLDYVSFSTAGMLDKWLTNERVYSPDHMGLQLTRLAVLGVFPAMGAVSAQS